MKILFLALYFIIFDYSFAQEKKLDYPLFILDKDSLNNDYIKLDEVAIFSKPEYENNDAKKAHIRLEYMTKRVYPFAKMAADRLYRINKNLQKSKNKKQRRKYLKRVQKFTQEELSDTLKKYTIWEGQILIKLIHRQTGHTCYELMKVLKSGFQAFMYNTTAKIFSMSLKREYHPKYYYKDFLIEGILLKNFSTGNLKEQRSAFPIDYNAISKKWHPNRTDKIKPFELYTNKEEDLEDLIEIEQNKK